MITSLLLFFVLPSLALGLGYTLIARLMWPSESSAIISEKWVLLWTFTAYALLILALLYGEPISLLIILYFTAFSFIFVYKGQMPGRGYADLLNFRGWLAGIAYGAAAYIIAIVLTLLLYIAGLTPGQIVPYLGSFSYFVSWLPEPPQLAVIGTVITFVYAFIFNLILVAVPEESFFRLHLVGNMSYIIGGLSIVLMEVLWTVAHIRLLLWDGFPAGAIVIAVGGIILADAYLRFDGSVVVSSIAHATYNALIMASSYAAASLDFLGLLVIFAFVAISLLIGWREVIAGHV